MRRGRNAEQHCNYDDGRSCPGRHLAQRAKRLAATSTQLATIFDDLVVGECLASLQGHSAAMVRRCNDGEQPFARARGVLARSENRNLFRFLERVGPGVIQECLRLRPLSDGRKLAVLWRQEAVMRNMSALILMSLTGLATATEQTSNDTPVHTPPRSNAIRFHPLPAAEGDIRLTYERSFGERHGLLFETQHSRRVDGSIPGGRSLGSRRFAVGYRVYPKGLSSYFFGFRVGYWDRDGELSIRHLNRSSSGHSIEGKGVLVMGEAGWSWRFRSRLNLVLAMGLEAFRGGYSSTSANAPTPTQINAIVTDGASLSPRIEASFGFLF